MNILDIALALLIATPAVLGIGFIVMIIILIFKDSE